MLADYLYGKIILAIFMTVCAALDLRRMKIDRLVFAVMFLVTVGGYVWMLVAHKDVLWVRISIGMAVGVFLGILSLITKSKIGMGDAIFFGLVGMVLGCKTVLVFAGSILLCAFISLIICAVCLIKGETIKDKYIPFLPIVWPVGMAILFFSRALGLE